MAGNRGKGTFDLLETHTIKFPAIFKIDHRIADVIGRLDQIDQRMASPRAVKPVKRR